MNPCIEYLGISGHEPIPGPLNLVDHLRERPSFVVLYEMPNILQHENLRAVWPKFPNYANDFEELPSARVVEPFLATGYGKRLTRKSGG